MSDGNLFGLIRSRLPADPNADFLVEPDGTRLSYAAMVARSGRLANLLQSLGVRPGDRVAIQAEKSVSALLVYLATLRAGAVHLPLNPAYTPAEVRYFLGDAEPALFICRPEQEPEMRALAAGAGVARVETLGPDGSGSLAAAGLEAVPDFDDVAREAGDLAAILYTSGTTGRSKGAMLTHGNLASNAETLRLAWRFTAADRLLHALPIFHTHGLFVATNVTLLAGGSMLFLPAFDVDAILRFLPQAAAMMGVPTYYTRLLSRPDFTRDLAAHIRLFVSGSAPLSAETHREFEQRTGHLILERYGMTETNMITSNPYEGPRVPGSVGPPLPGVEVRIAEPATGAPLPQGEIGVIEVRGPNVFKGYWRMPEKTAEEFRPDGFFVTGDMGCVDAADYVRIVGRAKDVVISGGLNVYPAEVEAAIEALPGIAECAVIGVPHPDFGEGVVAVVSARPGEPPPDEVGIRAALRETLAAFKQPKRVFVVIALPRNAMGKVQKNVLRETYAGAFGAA
ncbi:MAG: malonyl-CoA/methylmalonyl-CoA synthetase [Sphingomonadales bacterium]|nr:malonyl-CoA/methylmalonyl-CoA synthetase [Sphingomonadales bacterium]